MYEVRSVSWGKVRTVVAIGDILGGGRGSMMQHHCLVHHGQDVEQVSVG
jgi:hypothetical protein